MKVLAGVLAGALIASYTPQFRSGVDAVTVDVLVTRDGRPVTGLTSADFELRDNGVRQKIQSVVVEDVPLNVMLAFDVSTSVAGEPLKRLQSAAAATLELLGERDEVALLCFAHTMRTWVPWTADRQAVRRQIDSLEASGGTGLHDAAFAALTLRNARPGTRSLVLLFTDGDDTMGWLPGQHVIDAARRNDTVVYGLGVRRAGPRSPGYRLDFRSGLQPPIPHMADAALRDSFIENLAGETGGRHVDVANVERLRETFVEILTEFRSRYLLTFTPEGVSPRGWHELEVKTTRGAGQVRARRGYLRDSAAAR